MLEMKVLKDSKEEINLYFNYDDNKSYLVNCNLVKPNAIYYLIITHNATIDKIFYSYGERSKKFKMYYTSMDEEHEDFLRDVTHILFNKNNSLTKKYKY